MIKHLQSLQHVSQELYTTTQDIAKKAYRVGWAHGCNHLYCVEGLAKGVVPTLIPLLEIMHITWLEGWIQILKGQRNLYRATLIVPSCFNFIKKPSISHALLAMQGICETGRFLRKYEVFPFNAYVKWSNQVGQLPVLRASLARYCVQRPEQLFTLASCLWELKLLADRYVHEPKRVSYTKALKRRDLLDTAHYVGRIALIIVRGSVQKAQLTKEQKMSLHVLDLATQSANLIKFWIKSPQN
jgi:hypothetical protein